ncbi:MAG: hypothetical protein BGO98_42995 [Myxococcales bacterium 68-20]|nr:MAG: hypothetical protein BGO98_42995 [Myxococcales bacterium 68-20]
MSTAIGALASSESVLQPHVCWSAGRGENGGACGPTLRSIVDCRVDAAADDVVSAANFDRRRACRVDATG